MMQFTGTDAGLSGSFEWDSSGFSPLLANQRLFQTWRSRVQGMCSLCNEHFFGFKRSPAFWTLSKLGGGFGGVPPRCWKPQECHRDKRSIAFWPILQGHFPLGAGRWQAHCKVQMALQKIHRVLSG